MTRRARITCISKSDRYNPHERIRYIGGIRSDGQRWKMGEQQAIMNIENSTYSFYVQAGGKTVDVVIAISPSGNKYLRTTADDAQPDNLLSLPECP